MSHPFKYDIDTQTGQATLSLYVGGDYVTQYTYQNNYVTLSARPATDMVSFSQTQENVNLISRWINNIQGALSPNRLKRTTFKEDIEKKETKITAKFTVGNTHFGDVTFEKDDLMFRFKPRPQITMNFNDFMGWYNFLNRLITVASDWTG